MPTLADVRAIFRSRGGQAVAEALLCAALAFLAFAADSAIFTANLKKPTCWLLDGDGVSFAAMHFKGTIDNGWYSFNRFIGAPGGADLRDFPAPDLFYLGAIKLVGTLTRDWVVTWNVLIIAGYPLAAASSFTVMRRYGVRLGPALACGVLYALLPFHQLRLYGHAHLGIVYFGVPLAIVPALEILRGSKVLVTDEPLQLLVRGHRASIGLLALAAFTGLWGYVYFTFFAVATVLLAGGVQALRTRTRLPLLRAALLAGVSAIAFVVQNASVLAHMRAEGRAAIALRAPSDSETFGLKLVQLVLPMPGHRVEALRNLRRAYDASAPLVNENSTAYLGAVGVVGFFILLAVVARGPRTETRAEASDEIASRAQLLWSVAFANLVAFLLGTIGGLGALVAYLGFADVRSYNRISVFVGFYALFAIAIVVSGALSRARTRAIKIAANVAIGAAAILGVYDQTFAGTPDYPAFGREFDADTAFIRRVEDALPDGANVFMLPYMMFPEGGPKVNLADYAHLAPYLHGEKLRWSYGALRGRIADARYKELASARTAPSLVEGVTLAGYAALWVDPRGFEESEAQGLLGDLRQLLGEPTVLGPRGIFVWSLADYERSLRATLGPAFDARARAYADRPFLGFNDGFHLPESAGGSFWYAAQRSAKLFVVNPSDHVQRLTLDTYYRTATPVAASAKLRIDGDLFQAELDITPENGHLVKELDVPPGTHLVHFHTDAPTAPTEVDPRKRALILQHPTLQASAPPATSAAPEPPND